MQRFETPTIYFAILSFLLASCSAVTPVASTNTITPSVTPLSTNTATPTFTPTPNRIGDFALSPDGSKIAIFANDSIFIYDTSTLEKNLFSDDRGHGNCGGAVAFNPDGTAIAFTSTYPDNYVYVEDVASREILWSTYDVPNGHCINEIEFSPNGRTIFVRSTFTAAARCEYTEDSLELYSLDRASTVFFESRLLQVRWCRYSIGKIRFLDDGKFYLFLWTETNSWLYMGDSTTDQITEQHEYDISKDGWYYDISQDGQALAISPSHGMFENPMTTLVDPTSRKTLAVVPYYVKLLKGQNQFLVHDLTYAWKFWKNGGVSCSYDFIVNENYLKFSADGNFLAVPVSESRVEIWKVSTCEKVNTISVGE
ncbi:MAG: WD40 repeat domain-containing protein [Chloroflexota bacterium]